MAQINTGDVARTLKIATGNIPNLQNIFESGELNENIEKLKVAVGQNHKDAVSFLRNIDYILLTPAARKNVSAPSEVLSGIQGLHLEPQSQDFLGRLRNEVQEITGQRVGEDVSVRNTLFEIGERVDMGKSLEMAFSELNLATIEEREALLLLPCEGFESLQQDIRQRILEARGVMESLGDPADLKTVDDFLAGPNLPGLRKMGIASLEALEQLIDRMPEWPELASLRGTLVKLTTLFTPGPVSFTEEDKEWMVDPPEIEIMNGAQLVEDKVEYDIFLNQDDIIISKTGKVIDSRGYSNCLAVIITPAGQTTGGMVAHIGFRTYDGDGTEMHRVISDIITIGAQRFGVNQVNVILANANEVPVTKFEASLTTSEARRYTMLPDLGKTLKSHPNVRSVSDLRGMTETKYGKNLAFDPKTQRLYFFGVTYNDLTTYEKKQQAFFNYENEMGEAEAYRKSGLLNPNAQSDTPLTEVNRVNLKAMPVYECE